MSLLVLDNNYKNKIDSMSDINLLEDIYFMINDLTRGQCEGKFTRIDSFDLECKLTDDDQ